MRCYNTRMVSRREWLWVFAAGAALLSLVFLPYLAAYAAPRDTVFAGILWARADGYSYLAKMREGWRGAWTFTLPYTAEPGPGVFLYTYYLLLGHMARWTGLGLAAVYHLARLAGGALLLGEAYHFIAQWIESVASRRRAWLLFAAGSGLGWVVIYWVPFPPDWLIAESIPFMSLLGNAHFPLAWTLQLVLWELTLPMMAKGPAGRRLALAALMTTLLMQVQPLTLPPTLAVVGAGALGQMWERRAWRWADLGPAAVVSVSAAPWVAYGLWVTQTLPMLKIWGAQNLTPSPPLWLAWAWGGVPLLLAGYGLWQAARRRTAREVTLGLWFVAGVVLAYLPLALQRRLSMGFWMAVVLLAVRALPERWPRWAVLVGAPAVVASNVLMWLAVMAAALTRPPELFLSAAEAQAMAALPAGALVLAAPETGAFIPVFSDARVLYGHPFETVEAERREAELNAFFSGRAPAYADAQHADLVFYGLREAQLGPRPVLPGWRTLFSADAVTVYARP